jgi:glutamate racemase
MTTHPGPTIGVFDSGFGGLTVLRALLPLIPGAQYVYLGDTARLPYGAKSQATIARYAVESARFLVAQGAQMLVIACNTATALALPEIEAAVPVPVVGVIEPGVDAAASSGSPRSLLVLATAATVQSHAYLDSCRRHHLHATEKATPLLVPLVEEGWTDHPITREILRIYLAEALSICTPSAVILGCTHYPLIAGPIEETLRSLGCNAPIVDSAAATARAAAEIAATLPAANPTSTATPTFTCYATDSVEKFQRLGSQFLGQPLDEVELIDLGG